MRDAVLLSANPRRLRHSVRTFLPVSIIGCKPRQCRGTVVMVRAYWPSCHHEWKAENATPVDAFWVEATHEGATESVFPMLSVDLQLESERLGAEGQRTAGEISQVPRPFFFLVARDLSVIDPHAARFPSHKLWNGYSPFRSIAERTITSVDELAGIPTTSSG